MAKITIEFDGFDEALKRFEEMEKDLKPVVEKALEKTHRIMTPGIESAITPHHMTGRTEASLHSTPKVKWNGNVGEIDIGFNISKGGLPSIFLMYGTPKMRPDMKLWDAFFGSNVKKKVSDAQKRIVMEELSL